MSKNFSKTLLKSKNRLHLLRVQTVKVTFYPVILLLDSLGILNFLKTFIDSILPRLGIKKSVNTFFQYRDYSQWFKEDFIKQNEYSRLLLFPTMLGANSNLTMINLLFAKYFLTKGYKPLFIVCDAGVPICSKERANKSRKNNPFFCHECWRGFQTIEKYSGISILYFKELFVEKLESIYENHIRIIDKIMNLDQCINYKYHQVPLGIMTKKSVLRYILRGGFSGKTHEVDIYKKFLKSSLKEYLIFEKVFKDNSKIGGVIVNNGTLSFESIVRYLSEKHSINYMTFETFIGNNSIIYKKNAEVMNLDWSNELSEYKKKFEINDSVRNSVAEFFSNLKTGKESYAKLNIEHDENKMMGISKYACLFTNLNFDTAVIDKHTIFSSMEEWIFSTIDFWENYVEDIKLIIRIHPAEVKLLTATKEFMGDLIKNSIKTDKIVLFDSIDKVNSYHLMKNMQYGLVYSSTIGLEMAYLGIPCVVAGKPYYRNRGFIINPNTKEEYFDYIEKLNDPKFKFVPDIDELTELIYYTYFVRTKRLNGIKVWTPDAEKNCIYTNSSDMILNNKQFFSEFSNEFSEE